MRFTILRISVFTTAAAPLSISAIKRYWPGGTLYGLHTPCGGLLAQVREAKLEDLVQGFCRRKLIRGGHRAAFVKPECEGFTKEHKRDIVGHFLGQGLSVKSLVEKKEDICAKRIQSCSLRTGAGPGARPVACEHCRTLFELLPFECARKGPVPAQQPPRKRPTAVL